MTFLGGAARFIAGAAFAVIVMLITDTLLHWSNWASAITVAAIVFPIARFVERHRDREDARISSSPPNPLLASSARLPCCASSGRDESRPSARHHKR
jgi:hypothetical protein